MDNPCKGCSTEKRKEIREAANVNSCKTVCEKWIQYEKWYREKNEIINKQKRILKQTDYYIRDAVDRNRKSKKSRRKDD